MCCQASLVSAIGMQIQVGSFGGLQGFTLLIGHQLGADNAQLVTCIRFSLSQSETLLIQLVITCLVALLQEKSAEETRFCCGGMQAVC